MPIIQTIQVITRHASIRYQAKSDGGGCDDGGGGGESFLHGKSKYAYIWHNISIQKNQNINLMPRI